MKKFTTIFLIFAFIVCSVNVAQAEDKIKLKYDFQVGAKLKYSMKIDGDVTIQVNQNGMIAAPKNTAKMQGDFNYTHEITKNNAAEQAARINVIYGQSEMNTIVNGQKISNSDVPLLNGKIAVIDVGYNGQVIKYKLPDELPVSLQNADFKNMFTIFPDRFLRIGESWMENSETVNEDNENYLVINTVNLSRTLLGIEQKKSIECAKVKVVGNTTTITKSKKPQLKLDGKVEARIEGIVYYDLNRGYIVYSAIKNTINNVVTTGQMSENFQTDAKEITTILNTDLNTVVELL
ncbi:MAG: hypothetical protein KKD05_08250 [Candidatus Omnitrophica bacterium]|nr:hypothetical protein [Candidatus Omnitrophota bacterium]